MIFTTEIAPRSDNEYCADYWWS